MYVLLVATLLSAVEHKGSQEWTVYFRTECLACRKQFAELACLERKAWQLKLVGIGNDTMALRQEALRFGPKHLKVETISNKTAAELGINATPAHQVKGKNGSVSWSFGLKKCDSDVLQN